MSIFNDTMASLRSGYGQSWMRLTPLGRFFEQNNHSPFEFWKTFSNSSFFVQKWFIYCLTYENQTDYENKKNFLSQLMRLKEQGLDTEKNILFISNLETNSICLIQNLVDTLINLKDDSVSTILVELNPNQELSSSQHYFSNMVDVLRTMYNAHIDWNVLKSSYNPFELAHKLIKTRNIISNDSLFNKILTLKNIEFLHDYLNYLDTEGILDEAIQSAIISHSQPVGLAQALALLNQSGICDEANRSAIISHSQPVVLAQALQLLNQSGICDEANRSAIISHSQPVGLAQALQWLHQSGICDEANRSIIMEFDYSKDKESSSSLIKALVLLNQAGNFKQRYRQALLKTHAPESLAKAFITLYEEGIKPSEVHFNQLIGSDRHLSSFCRSIKKLRNHGIFPRGTEEINFIQTRALRAGGLLISENTDLLYREMTRYAIPYMSTQHFSKVEESLDSMWENMPDVSQLLILARSPEQHNEAISQLSENLQPTIQPHRFFSKIIAIQDQKLNSLKIGKILNSTAGVEQRIGEFVFGPNVHPGWFFNLIYSLPLPFNDAELLDYEAQVNASLGASVRNGIAI